MSGFYEIFTILTNEVMIIRVDLLLWKLTYSEMVVHLLFRQTLMVPKNVRVIFTKLFFVIIIKLTFNLRTYVQFPYKDF